MTSNNDFQCVKCFWTTKEIYSYCPYFVPNNK